MTREEAINKLIRIRQPICKDTDAHEALGMAIDALAYQAELPEDLEEAALLYSSPMGRKDPEHLEEYPYSPADKAAFIAGAEWQKAKMMEKAVDGRVYKSYNVVHESGEPSFHGIELVYPDMDKPYIIAGDTVKVIFIPEKSEKVK